VSLLAATAHLERKPGRNGTLNPKPVGEVMKLLRTIKAPIKIQPPIKIKTSPRT